jgi:CRP/FNR family cyclic AMP-dependent transcriptional regulator
MESKKIGLFRNATDALSFTPGQTVFWEGDRADLMYVVQSGEVDIRLRGNWLETLGEGNISGEMSLISEEPRVATAVAKTELRLVPIDLKRFMFLVEETPYFAVQVMKILASRIRKMLPRLDPGGLDPPVPELRSTSTPQA